MKNYVNYVGIDVSKKTLDITVLDKNTNVIEQMIIENNISSITKLVKKLNKITNRSLYCFEDTGVYSVPLSVCLSSQQMDYWKVPAIEIAKSKGISRGKTDKTDAKQIALYSIRNIDKLRLGSLQEITIQKLKLLFSEREKLVKAIKLFSSSTEAENFIPKEVFNEVLSINSKTQALLKKKLTEIEKRINNLMKENTEINEQNKLLNSIPGIGPNTALYMILATEGFTKFDNWRQFACYSGVAPFEYYSGKSVRAKTKVNHLADKKMKKLLHLASMTAIKYDQQIKVYYERKKDEGKNAMLVLNNVRCKLLSRAFAVIKRQTPFVNTEKFVA